MNKHLSLGFQFFWSPPSSGCRVFAACSPLGCGLPEAWQGQVLKKQRCFIYHISLIYHIYITYIYIYISIYWDDIYIYMPTKGGCCTLHHWNFPQGPRTWMNGKPSPGPGKPLPCAHCEIQTSFILQESI